MAYRVRQATLNDADVLARHRIAMFAEMGLELDAAALDRAFRDWLSTTIPAGSYHAWLAEDADGAAAAGGGITVLPWPPGPRYMGDKLAFAYNVYTEPAHRRRGLARLIMETIHGWCREAGVSSIALNASHDGLPLYESMGYQVSPSPMMFFPIVRV